MNRSCQTTLMLRLTKSTGHLKCLCTRTSCGCFRTPNQDATPATEALVHWRKSFRTTGDKQIDQPFAKHQQSATQAQ